MKSRKVATYSESNAWNQKSLSNLHSLIISSSNDGCGLVFNESAKTKSSDVIDCDQSEAPCGELSGTESQSSAICSNETSGVRRGRILVVIVLILSAMSAGFFYWSLRRTEEKNSYQHLKMIH
jgi:hypothetical protein